MTDTSAKRTIDQVELEKDDAIKGKVAKTKSESTEELNTESLKENKVDENKEEEEQKEEKDKEDEKKEKKVNGESLPKKETIPFVFGSTTSFGNMGGFKMFGSINKNSFSSFGTNNKDNEKETICEKGNQHEKNDELTKDSKINKNVTPETFEKEETETSIAKPSIFGSGSTFGNAFQNAITKKSVFDELKSSTGDDKSTGSENDDKEKEKEKEMEKDVYKKVHLEKQDVKSGEENEETIFQVKAKLYHMELSKMSLGWKERGFGIIKVNKFIKSPSDNYNSRLIMRQNGNLKLILNLPIAEGFNVLKGMPSSLTGNKFIRLQVLEAGEPVQYAIKVGQPENAEKLFESIEQQIPK